MSYIYLRFCRSISGYSGSISGGAGKPLDELDKALGLGISDGSNRPVRSAFLINNF